MSTADRFVRVCAWSASGCGLGALGAGVVEAVRTERLHGWIGEDASWLVLDHLARHPAPGAGVVGALVGFVVGVVSVVVLAGGQPAAESGAKAPARRFTLGLDRPLVALALLALALLGPRLVAAALRPDPAPGAPHVLFVLVDTWRADHAGFLGYERDVTPELDRLVRSGIVFERVEAQAGWTKPSVATLLTGLMPSKHGAVSEPLPPPARGTDLVPGVTTLFEVLRARGWDTAMWSNNPHVLPSRGFGQGAGAFFDYIHHPDRTFQHDPGVAARLLSDVTQWLAEERDPSRPFCAYVHLFDPHAPYAAPPEFRGRFARGAPDSTATKQRVQRMIDAYDEEILAVDHALGPFLQSVLEEHPDTVVVLCSDHGEEFLDHGGYGHAHTLYEELTRVPLVLWGPDLAGGRVATQVRLMDVYPTLLELSGNADAIAPKVQGASLLAVIRGDETGHRLAPAESGGDGAPARQWRAIGDGRLKLVRREADRPPPTATASTEGARGPEEGDETPPWIRLFDLEHDPGENHSLHLERASEAALLFERMRERGWYVPPERLLELAPGTRTESDRDLQLLRDLGYVGSDS